MARLSCRERLIEAGIETLHGRGFNACGVQEIADAAGAPKGSFYNHFASKEEFGAEVVERYWQRSTLRKILSDRSLTPRTRLQRYFAALGRALAGIGYERGCLIGNFSAELADQSRLIRDRLTSLFAGWVRLVETCIREAQAAGEVRKDANAATLAAFVVNAWEGAVLRAKVEKDGSALDDFMTVVFSSLLI